MLVRCINCNGVLEYDSVSKKLYCYKCACYYEKEENAIEYNSDVNYFYPEMHYCVNCNSEIKISNLDTEKKCIFCGNRTELKNVDANSIMQTGDYLKPDYIIPFSLREHDAEKKVQDFTRANIDDKLGCRIESIKPVYLPYALYDISVNGNVFERIPVNISDKYVDETLLEIEYYDYNSLIDFEEEKIKDYYAELVESDMVIQGKENRKSQSEFFGKHIAQMLNYKNIWDEYSSDENLDEKIECIRRDYVLLPVWFTKVVHKNREYTILVNGQSGLTVGEHPPNRKTVFDSAVILATEFTIVVSIMSICFGGGIIGAIGGLLILSAFVAITYVAIQRKTLRIFSKNMIESKVLKEKNYPIDKYSKNQENK